MESLTRSGNHNISTSQLANISKNMSHEIIQTPSTSAPSFGGSPCIFDIRNKNIKIHELILQVVPSDITGITGASTNYPCYVPLPFWINKVEIFINGNNEDTIYGADIFIRNQLYRADEGRAIWNQACGPYDSVSKRYAMSSGSQYWSVALKSLFNESHFALITQNHEVQIKVYFNPVSLIVNVGGGTGTATATIQSASIISRVSKIDDAGIQKAMAILSKSPITSLFHESKYQPLSVSSGTSTTNQILTAITGNVALLYFIVRPQSGLVGDGAFSFTEIKDWNLLDSSGTSLIGGSNLNSRLSILQLGKWWSQSTYLAEAYKGTSNAFVYMWSFSPDPSVSLATGQQLGSRLFRGSETLSINFTASLGSAVNIDVFTMNYAGAIQTLNTVNKVSTF